MNTLTIKDLTDAGAIDTTLDLPSGDLGITLRAYPLAGPEVAARKRIRAAIEEYNASKAAGVETQEADPLERTMRVMEAELSVDERRYIAEEIVAWVVRWDLKMEAEGETVPLDPNALYELDLPTGTLQGLLHLIKARRGELDNPASPLVTSPSKRTSRQVARAAKKAQAPANVT